MRPALIPALIALNLLAAHPLGAAPSATPTLGEQWRFARPGLSVRALLPRPDGGLIVAGEFDAPLALGDGQTLTPRGDHDIVLLVLDRDGRLRGAHALGGPGDDRAHGLALAEKRAQLLATTRGSLDVGGRTISAPRGESEYLPGISALAITLAADGRPERVRLAVPHADHPRLAALPDGLVFGYDRDRMLDGPETCTVARYIGDKPVWSRTFADLDLIRLDVLRGAVHLAAGGKRRLEVHPLDPETGADQGPLTALSTPFGGDRGGITALIEGPAGLRMIGHSGRDPVTVASGATESHPIEPFALQLGRPDKARRQIIDAIASVAAVGRIGDELATVVEVIHTGPRYGGTSPSHPGAWLTIGLGAPLRLVPIHPRGAGARDTGIGYISPSRGSIIAEKHITLMGRCNARGDLGCVVRLRVK